MTRKLRAGSGKHQQGFTYVEVVLAVLILSLALIPAMNAIRGSIAATREQQGLISGNYAVFSKMEYVLAQPYGNLESAAAAAGGPANPSSYSDPVSTPARVFVYLAPYDGDNGDSDNDPFTGGDPGLLWIRVALADGSGAMESLASIY
jgi:type II secretory pathway pseudopilin PulG